MTPRHLHARKARLRDRPGLPRVVTCSTCRHPAAAVVAGGLRDGGRDLQITASVAQPAGDDRGGREPARAARDDPRQAGPVPRPGLTSV